MLKSDLLLVWHGGRQFIKFLLEFVEVVMKGSASLLFGSFIVLLFFLSAQCTDKAFNLGCDFLDSLVGLCKLIRIFRDYFVVLYRSKLFY